MPSSTTNSPAARRARQSADAVEVPNTAPPPYPGDNTYDLTPLPHTVNRPRLPEDRRNPHLSHGKYHCPAQTVAMVGKKKLPPMSLAGVQ